MTGSTTIRPWAALWSMILGFFVILVDTTIVSVANPTIMSSLNTSMTMTLWATSAYLLAYAVPLLITGRLGDRFGLKRIYIFGLILFTVASLLCGLAPTIEWLVVARAAQGLGAACMSPQTMAIVTRIFPRSERGAAMATWGVTAGVAMMVGPILGGFLLDAFGWEWIFFINIPVGIIGVWLAMRYVPDLPTHARSFDYVGVILSGIGMFLIVFGIQEGQTYDWGTIWGPISIWSLIIVGFVVLAVFVLWQHRLGRRGGEPLVPLALFRDRNFSLGSGAILLVGLTTTAMSLPLMFFLQVVRHYTPTQSALLLLPMAIMSLMLARPVGKLIDRSDPRWIATIGLTVQALGMLLFVPMFNETTPVALMLIPSTVLGLSNSMMWGSLATITTYNLKPQFAGAGSGVYNTGRQIGAVLGSAMMAMLMDQRLTMLLGSAATSTDAVDSASSQLPAEYGAGYALAMGQSLLLPAGAVLLAAVMTLFFAKKPEQFLAHERE